MRQVSNEFLLNMAEVSATLIGLFLVGVFFYVEPGFRRFDRARERFEPYLRSGTRITMILFAISLGLSLALVALTLPVAIMPSSGRFLHIRLPTRLLNEVEERSAERGQPNH